MSDAFRVGSIALEQYQKALSTTANNIANLQSGQFKRSEMSFSELVAVQDDNTQSLGMRANEVRMLSQQGELRVTGNELDLAIDGHGLIELLGPNGHYVYWRGGTLSVGSDGFLQSSHGYPLADMINVPFDTIALQIDSDGTVSSLISNALEEFGLIRLVKAGMGLDELVTRHTSDGLYRFDDAGRPSDIIPGEEGAGIIVQGALEMSNVDLNEEMVRLLLLQRGYAANSQMVQAADQFLAIANNLRQ